MRKRLLAEFAPSAPRPEKGSIFVGCALGCGVLVLVAVVSVLVFLWWLLAPITIPQPQSVMLPEAQSFVVAGATELPEPATMSLLALGGLGMLINRRRNRS